MNFIHSYMLDTNAASALIRGRAAPTLVALVAEGGMCLSVITEAEMRYGVARKPEATRLARTVAAFLQDTPVIPWTSATAQTYAALRTSMESRGVSLSSMDMLIAAQALAEDCTLLTADQAFSQVPGLKVKDWREGD